MNFWLAVLGMLFLSLGAILVFSLRVNGQSDSKPKYFWAVLGLVCFVSLFLYQQLGAEKELGIQAKMTSLAEEAAANPEASRAKTIELVREFESATRAYPEKPEYWYLLGTQQTALARHPEAAESYARAYALAPGDVSLLARQTEAEFLAAEYNLTDTVRSLIDQVLEKAPNQPTIMGILGIMSYRTGQFDSAVQFWERALIGLPANSPDAQAMRATIAQAQAQNQAQSGSTSVAASPTQGGVEETSSEGIRVNVALADGISVPPATTLFVFIRQAGGPPMPIVVERTTVGTLPTEFYMDDSSVMIPGQSLANFPSLEIVARVSFSGQPTAQSGDYEVVYGPITLAEIEAPIDLTIADQLP